MGTVLSTGDTAVENLRNLCPCGTYIPVYSLVCSSCLANPSFVEISGFHKDPEHSHQKRSMCQELEPPQTAQRRGAHRPTRWPTRPGDSCSLSHRGFPTCHHLITHGARLIMPTLPMDTASVELSCDFLKVTVLLGG